MTRNKPAVVGGGFRRLVLAWGLVGVLCAGPAGAQETEEETETDWPLNVNTILDAISENFLPEDVRAFQSGDWQKFWGVTEDALGSQSLEEVAMLLPVVREVLDGLEEYPDLQPYTAWLASRAEYFEVAAEVLAPREAPATSSRTEGKPPELFKPPKSVPPPSSTPPSAERKPAGSKPVGKRAPAPLPASKPEARPQTGLARTMAIWKNRVAKRSAPDAAEELAPRLKAIFKEEGVPEAWVWMAEVESSFDADARSPVGAVGLFQLMPATAERFGLRTGWLDERRNPEKSARAAARYLKILYREFGSWPLAFAAYNSGEGRVRKLQGTRKAGFEDIAARLPVETRLYVPRIMATVSLREKISDPAGLPAPRMETAGRDWGLFAETAMAFPPEP